MAGQDQDAARQLAQILGPILAGETAAAAKVPTTSILSAVDRFIATLPLERPLSAAFHDGQVHDPLGGGAYAFAPLLAALADDEASDEARDKARALPSASATGPTGLPTRPVVVHVGAQPNNSPHAGTIVVFCYAFIVARSFQERLQADSPRPPPVTVQMTFVDTAPVNGEGLQEGDVHYQRCYRDVPGALETHLADYRELLHLLSTWSGVAYTVAYQSDLFASPSMPSLLGYLVENHATLGRQLSPKYGALGLRAACPVSGCGLAEKHGLQNEYGRDSITFQCPRHGPHSVCVSDPAQVARVEANTPARNLVRCMSQLLDTARHHVRVTGADYAGTYQEFFLYRPLAAWSAATGLAAGRTPHILYAPLIVDWSGAKLSKSLYVCEGGYDSMELLGSDALCSYSRLKSRFHGGDEGLRRIWVEVQGWVKDSRKLFRSYSVDYLQRVILTDRPDVPLEDVSG